MQSRPPDAHTSTLEGACFVLGAAVTSRRDSRYVGAGNLRNAAGIKTITLKFMNFQFGKAEIHLRSWL